jgi:exodeoxyribonuclease III
MCQPRKFCIVSSDLHGHLWQEVRDTQGAVGAMKIATFNINNVNKHLPNLLHWLESSKPDVVCLQELKCTDREFPIAAIREAGYRAVWRGQRTWNGVAILARAAEPIVTRTTLPGDPSDDQARYIEAAVGGILIGCLYLPNGNPQPGPKFDYKKQHELPGVRSNATPNWRRRRQAALQDSPRW